MKMVNTYNQLLPLFNCENAKSDIDIAIYKFVIAETDNFILRHSDEINEIVLSYDQSQREEAEFSIREEVMAYIETRLHCEEY